VTGLAAPTAWAASPGSGAGPAWTDENQRQLVAALGEVRAALERHAADPTGRSGTAGADPGEPGGARPAAPAALETIRAAFRLSPFECQVLLLAAGPELDGRFPALCAAANGDPARPWPTFGLALAALPGAHWSALAPGGPLRRWRLLELAGGGLAAGQLRVDERVLHYLAGAGEHDAELGGLLSAVPPDPDLPPSHAEVAGRLVALWHGGDGGLPPVPQLAGRPGAAKAAVAAAAAASLGLGLSVLDARLVPSDPREAWALARLLEREVVLGGTALLLDADETDEPERLAAAASLAEAVAAPLALAARERVPQRRRGAVALDVGRPTPAEQRELWSRLAGADAPLDALAGEFDLDPPAIRAAVAAAGGPGGLWDACRAQARPRLGALAQRIAPSAGWDELVLPQAQRALLGQLALHARHRLTVYERWGLRRGRRRGLGATALFSGPSGTGKTLAAEVLAGELDLDLHRIDLSSVVSKYIGETERNLRRVFDAADDGGSVLLFDEADALFGKRAEVKDSHDRYANIEVSYLLQRMEEHRGVAVLTTNMREALDLAFLRRIRFVIEFPFPDLALRAEIWRRAFPPETPTAGLDPERLARLNLAGGAIRNIAVAAAFLAADDGGVVRMTHLLRAARVECAKLNQPFPAADLGGAA
jgi:ATPase family associated with various cellular activities (AAA)